MFSMDNHSAYAAWREMKLSFYPAKTDDLLVNISALSTITENECQKVLALCNTYNMAVYQTANTAVTPSYLKNLAEHFGLLHLDHHYCTEDDGISRLTVSQNPPKNEFIPYSNRPIGWHTDGYYNPSAKQILGLMLHCVQPAITGGTSALMDHEIAYILLRDKNPDFIRVLMAPDCLTIPAYCMDGVEVRKKSTGPVFSVNDSTGKLHMRYTMRKHNIIWKNDPLLLDALAYLNDILSNDSDWVFTHQLAAGQGVVTNNVLHLRTGFTDDPKHRRLLYRARFFDRVSNPDKHKTSYLTGIKS